MVGTALAINFRNTETRTRTGKPSSSPATTRESPKFNIKFSSSVGLTSATKNWETQGANPVSTNLSSSDSNNAFLNSIHDFYSAARDSGHTYQRTDPSSTNGMDCCTGPWNHLKTFLSSEDWAKLKPLKPQAYNMLDANLTEEQRIRGFSGAIQDAGIGTAQKVDKDFIASLEGKSDAEIQEALVGTIATYSGKNGGHVFVISDAWRDPNTGEIKYKMLGPHIQGADIEEGGNSGIGTRTKVYSLNDDTRPGEHLTIATLNSDVIARANQNKSGQELLASVKGNPTVA